MRLVGFFSSSWSKSASCLKYSAHTAVLFAIIFVFIFNVYATNPKIGSFEKMYQLLTQAAAENPVPGNAHGSYLTMRSKNGLIFGVINIIGNCVYTELSRTRYLLLILVSQLPLSSKTRHIGNELLLHDPLHLCARSFWVVWPGPFSSFIHWTAVTYGN